jgi:hypothetical protein
MAMTVASATHADPAVANPPKSSASGTGSSIGTETGPKSGATASRATATSQGHGEY